MNYRQLENEMVNALQPLVLEGLEVVALPEVQAAYSKTVTSRIFVSYGGSKYDKPQSTDIISQNETINILIILQSRFLDSGNGIYPLMETVKQLLLGFRPQHVSRLYLSTIEFDKYEDNVWNYIMTFECNKIHVQQLQDTEPDGVPLHPANVTYSSTVNNR